MIVKERLKKDEASTILYPTLPLTLEIYHTQLLITLLTVSLNQPFELTLNVMKKLYMIICYTTVIEKTVM